MTNLWKLGLAWSITLLVLLLFSYPFVDKGSATEFIWFASAGILLVAIGGSSIIIHFRWRPFVEK